MTDRTKPFFNASLALTLLAFAVSPLMEAGLPIYLTALLLKVLILSMLAVHLYRGIKTGVVEFPRSPLDLAVFAFLLVAAASVSIAAYKYLAILWLQMFLLYALFFYLATAVVAQGRRALGYAAAAVLVMGAVETEMGLIQWVFGDGRPHGGFVNPDLFAGYLVPSIILASSLMFSRHEWARGYVRRTGLFLLACTGTITIFLTGSRGGALALFTGLLVLMWARWRGRALAAAALLVALAVILPTPVRDKVFSNDVYAYSRIGIWESAIRMAAHHPLGVGLDNLQYYWGRYNFANNRSVVRYEKFADTAHDAYLQIAADMGVAGIAAFLYGVFLLARAGIRAVRASGPGGDSAIALGAAGGITAILSHGLVEANLHESGIMLQLITLTVVLFSTAPRDQGRTRLIAIGPRARPRAAVLSAVLILAVLAWVAMPAAGAYFAYRAKDVKNAGGGASKEMRMNGWALFFSPADAMYHDTRAAILYRMYRAGGDAGRIEEALKELDVAERLNPGELEYPYRKAVLKMELARRVNDPARRGAILESALGDARREAYLYPLSAKVLYRQVQPELDLGKRRDAISALERIKAIEPNFLKGRLALAKLYTDMGEYGLSRRECYSIIGIHKSLENMPLTEWERDFVSVDVDEVEGLLKKTEGRTS